MRNRFVLSVATVSILLLGAMVALDRRADAQFESVFFVMQAALGQDLDCLGTPPGSPSTTDPINGQCQGPMYEDGYQWDITFEVTYEGGGHPQKVVTWTTLDPGNVDPALTVHSNSPMRGCDACSSQLNQDYMVTLELQETYPGIPGLTLSRESMTWRVDVENSTLALWTNLDRNLQPLPNDECTTPRLCENYLQLESGFGSSVQTLPEAPTYFNKVPVVYELPSPPGQSCARPECATNSVVLATPKEDLRECFCQCGPNGPQQFPVRLYYTARVCDGESAEVVAMTDGLSPVQLSQDPNEPDLYYGYSHCFSHEYAASLGDTVITVTTGESLFEACVSVGCCPVSCTWCPPWS